MAMKKSFYTMNGQMMAYDEGGVTKDFLTDHLGSITAEIDQSQTRTYETRYSAYGHNNWSTGTGCGFGWVGAFGYRETGLFHMSHYVRARHYSYLTGNWSTVDPLWPREPMYRYVRSQATRIIDYSGLSPNWNGCGEDGKGQGGSLAGCCKDLAVMGPKNSPIRQKIYECMGSGRPGFKNHDTIDFFLSLLVAKCRKGGAANSVCVSCQQPGGDIPGFPPECSNPCDNGFWAYTYPRERGIREDDRDLPKDSCGMVPIGDDCPGFSPPKGGSNCDCRIVMCKGAGGNDQSTCAVFYHELSHCSGLGHPGGEPPPPRGIPRDLDFIYKLGCCVCRAVNKVGGCGAECDRIIV